MLGGGGLGDGEDKRGAGMTMPGWDSFSISVFLKNRDYIITKKRRMLAWYQNSQVDMGEVKA